MERLDLTVSIQLEYQPEKQPGIPIQPPIFGAKAINLKLQWTSAKLRFCLYTK
jgi:hypothetical protein